MSEKRLRVVRMAPSLPGPRVDEYTVGPEGRPAYIIVVRGEASSSDLDQLAMSLGDGPRGKRLVGAPIVHLPRGGEFEIWEIEE